MLMQGDEPEVEIKITVPESLGKFIKSAEESDSYMWVITYLNPLKPGNFIHARTIHNFQIPEILGALEKHKQEFSRRIVGPFMQRGTAVIVDDPGGGEQPVAPADLKVIEIARPDATNTKEHPGWE